MSTEQLKTRIEAARAKKAQDAKNGVIKPDRDGNTPTKGKRAAADVVPPAETLADVIAAEPAIGGPGRGKIVDRLTTEQLAAEIASLISELKATADGNDKKRIRRALRLRGHKGGLNVPRKTHAGTDIAPANVAA